MKLALTVLLAGCLVGPPYHVPSAPLPVASRYKEAWKVATPSDAMRRGRWWEMFGEPELNALEERLNIDNQTIKQAYEQFMAARAQIRIARAQYYPTVTASPNVTVSRGRAGSGISTTSTTATTTQVVANSGGSVHSYTLPLEASWAPDLFGRVRNSVREAQYGAQVSAADLENQRLIAQATLAQTYFQLRGQDALEETLNATVRVDEQILDIARSRFDTGVDTEVAAVQAEQTLEAARVQATNAAILRAQFEHAIATLLGIPATAFSIPKRAHLANPPAIPTGAPSELLERRPDIAMAERQMAQANAVIGIGYAAYFPTLTLSGTAGFASTALSTLLTWPSRVWSIGATISEALFDGGLRRATIDQSIATYNANVANYRQVVLVAFQQVEDALSATRILGDEIRQQRRLVALAERALELERGRYETGIDPYLNLMTQQTIVLSAQETLVSLQTQQLTSAVSLIEALGGGWQKSDLPKP